MEQMKRVRAEIGASTLNIHDMHQQDDDQILTLVRELCRDVSRPLIITAKNLRSELAEAHAKGKRIVTRSRISPTIHATPLSA